MSRVMVFNGADWEPIDWDVPAQAGTISSELNHSTMITLDISALYNRRLYKGYPNIYKNMSHIAVQDDDGHFYAGIVKDSPLGESLDVTAHGHSVLSKDFPWHGASKSWTGVDGIRVFREVWNHIITHGKIPRLELTGATSGGSLVGKPASAGWRNLTTLIEAAQKFVTKRDDRVAYWERWLNKRAAEVYRLGGKRKVGEIEAKDGPPEIGDVATYKAVIELNDGAVQAVHFWDWTGVGAGRWTRLTGSNLLAAARTWRATEASLNRAKELYPTYVQRVEDLTNERDETYPDGAPEPYELTWWDARDLSSNLEEICELGAFDWHDACRWDGDVLIPQIHILGSKRAVRSDVHLEFGVNVINVGELAPGESASHISVLGAGEGSGTLRTERRVSHQRLVPVYRTISDKDLRTQQLVDKAADKERDAARKAIDPIFSTLTVIDHPLAPIADFRLGDRVSIVGPLRDGSDYQGIVQVTKIDRDLAGRTIAVEVKHD